MIINKPWRIHLGFRGFFIGTAKKAVKKELTAFFFYGSGLKTVSNRSYGVLFL